MVRLKLAVDEQVVHDASVGIKHHPVEDFAGSESADLIGEDMVDEALGVRAADEDLAHVGDVEHADLLPDGEMLGDDAGILDRHHEARKGTHLGAEGHVAVVQTGFEQGFFHSFCAVVLLSL